MRTQTTVSRRSRHMKAWQLFTPSAQRAGEARYAFRAALWVSMRPRAQAVPIPSRDIAAAMITARDRTVLVIAAYDLGLGGSEAADDEQLRGKLGLIQEAHNRVQAAQPSGRVGLLVCADFNRHHVLWGGARAAVEPGRDDEAEGIIDFMQENAMSSLLPAGTVTWESYKGMLSSTVDLMLASTDISDAATFCSNDQHDRGSDHRAIRAHFDIALTGGARGGASGCTTKQTGRRSGGR